MAHGTLGSVMGNKSIASKPKEIKIIFLDVDGVLNSLEGSPPVLDNVSTNIEDDLYVLEDDKVKLLKHIVSKTKAEIVVSSTWRNNASSLSRLTRKLKEFGMDIIGCTVQLDSNENRTIEIEMFLNEFKTRNDISVSHWVAIDDMVCFVICCLSVCNHSDFLYRISVHYLKDLLNLDHVSFRGHFVRCDEQYGLTQQLANDAISILNGN